MLKFLLLIFNVFSLFIYSLWPLAEEVFVSLTPPETLTAGQEAPLVLKITKGNVSGTGRLELKVSEGISLRSGENSGATFSFENSVATWTWEELPDTSEILVLAEMLAAPGTGSARIETQFSYSEDDLEKRTDPLVSELTVAAPQLAATTEPVENVLASRTIERGAGECTVTINIHKGATRGFARYSDDLPQGFAAKAVDTDGSSFSFSDGRIKFVWVSVPDKEDLKISYLLQKTTGSSVVLNGEYSYLEANQSRKHILGRDTVNFGVPVAVQTEKQEPEPVKQPEVAREPEKKPAWPKAAVSGETNGLQYHVQIGAFKNQKVTAAALKRRYKITSGVHSHLHEGLVKFLSGSFTEYRLARDNREKLRTANGVETAFVVAYNQGKRITVQEALMISNQKWYK
jgi:cell division septation protein DedD